MHVRGRAYGRAARGARGGQGPARVVLRHQPQRHGVQGVRRLSGGRAGVGAAALDRAFVFAVCWGLCMRVDTPADSYPTNDRIAAPARVYAQLLWTGSCCFQFENLWSLCARQNRASERHSLRRTNPLFLARSKEARCKHGVVHNVRAPGGTVREGAYDATGYRSPGRCGPPLPPLTAPFSRWASSPACAPPPPCPGRRRLVTRTLTRVGAAARSRTPPQSSEELFAGRVNASLSAKVRSGTRRGAAARRRQDPAAELSGRHGPAGAA